jgi:formylglycine-generating enzyme required for sulfatase activity
MNRTVVLFLSLIVWVVSVAACVVPTPTVMPTERPSQAPTATVPPLPTETPTPTPVLGDTRTRPADGMVMVYDPAGEFQTGSTDEEVDHAMALCDEYQDDCEWRWFDHESPAHAVALDSFWIDRAEVTNAQFAAFLNEEGNQEEEGVTWLELSEWSLIEYADGEFRPESGYADHPAVEVSWYGAAAYCQWAGSATADGGAVGVRRERAGARPGRNRRRQAVSLG